MVSDGSKSESLPFLWSWDLSRGGWYGVVRVLQAPWKFPESVEIRAWDHQELMITISTITTNYMVPTMSLNNWHHGNQ